MSEVSFEEETLNKAFFEGQSKNRYESGIVAFLVRNGIIKNTRSAGIFLVFLSVAIIGFAVYLIVKSGQPTHPVIMTSAYTR